MKLLLYKVKFWFPKYNSIETKYIVADNPERACEFARNTYDARVHWLKELGYAPDSTTKEYAP